MKDFLNKIETHRLIDAIFTLKNRKMIRSLSDLCVKCGKNKSYFNDVRTKNLNFSSDFIAKIFELYPINEEFILTGNGEILLGENGGNVVGDVNANNSGSGVQNVQTNCGHVENNTHTGGGGSNEVLQQLMAANNKLVETNAKMVETLAQMVENNSKLMENNSRLMETLSKLSEG